MDKVEDAKAAVAVLCQAAATQRKAGRNADRPRRTADGQSSVIPKVAKRKVRVTGRDDEGRQ